MLPTSSHTAPRSAGTRQLTLSDVDHLNEYALNPLIGQKIHLPFDYLRQYNSRKAVTSPSTHSVSRHRMVALSQPNAQTTSSTIARKITKRKLSKLASSAPPSRQGSHDSVETEIGLAPNDANNENFIMSSQSLYLPSLTRTITKAVSTIFSEHRLC